MSDPVVTRTQGTTVELAATAWASLCASFLGAGFRVDLPPGAERAVAAEYELARVDRLATLLGHRVPLAEWHDAVLDHPDRHVEICAGWPRMYGEPPRLWITSRPVVGEHPASTAAIVAARRAPRATDGLPTFSRLEDEQVLATTEADCGLWADHQGILVTSTAGPVIAQRADGSWVTGRDTAPWLAQRIAGEYGAIPDLGVDDLATARSVAIIRRADGIQPVRYRAADGPT
ncbi:MAG: hypothetical protein ACTHOG_07900 [Marmoricola sp.]